MWAVRTECRGAGGGQARGREPHQGDEFLLHRHLKAGLIKLEFLSARISFNKISVLKNSLERFLLGL